MSFLFFIQWQKWASIINWGGGGGARIPVKPRPRAANEVTILNEFHQISQIYTQSQTKQMCGE